MTREECKIGTVVWLRSGGPAMTISREMEDDVRLGCTWFIKRVDSRDTWDGPYEGEFSPDELEIVRIRTAN